VETKAKNFYTLTQGHSIYKSYVHQPTNQAYPFVIFDFVLDQAEEITYVIQYDAYGFIDEVFGKIACVYTLLL
jgi:hypothetical protein